MIFTDENRVHSHKQTIRFWASRIIDAVDENDMDTAFDILDKTLPKCWNLYQEELCKVLVGENLDD